MIKIQLLINMKKYIFRVITTVAVLISYGAFSQSEYYVSESLGSDSNAGTESAPFQSINKGISMLNPGDTVYVMEGVYTNNNFGTVDPSTNTNMSNPHVVTVNKSGTEDAYITLRNYPGHTPKIKFDGRGGIIISNNMNYIIIEGFEVEGPSQNIDYSMAIADREYKILCAEDGDSSTNYNNAYFGGKGIWGGYGAHKHVIIRNNIVHDTPGSAIRFNDSDYITIEDNIVYNSNWWTSSASSAIVFAETISEDGDNGSNIKMIIRGNLVYNNWNRIPFYVTQLPDNSGNTNPNYGTASYNNILDGQGIYVTRSDPGYNGTFLFENNICVNNGKNGINFDHSQSASAIYQNNTLYYNGVHEIIQDLSVEEGNPAHRGQKVGGIKANNVKNATVVNNIIMTRDNQFSTLQLNNVSGTRVAVNNLLVNGNYAWPANEENNLINLDPMFTMAPTEVLGEIDIVTTDFTLLEGSPAIDAGNPSYGPEDDYDDNPRPISTTGISSTTFEDSTGGWSSFGATIEISEDTALTGEKSLLTKDRTANWHSPRLVLSGIMTVGETYTFNVWVKLAEGETGNSQITIKNTDTNQYVNVTDQVQVSDQEWTLVSGDFTYEQENNMFVYVKGPSVVNGVGAEYYIDDFSLVLQGSPPVDFNSSGDIIDIGAYEYTDASIDTTPPVITLNGDNPMTIECGIGFTDPGALATDDIDGNISVNSSNDVNVTEVGTYEVIYTATDSSGNTSSETRTVFVQGVLSEIVFGYDSVVVADWAEYNYFLTTEEHVMGRIHLGGDNYNIENGFLNPIAIDNCGGTNYEIVVTGDDIDFDTIGYYTQTYTATDSFGNSVSATLTFQVIDPLSISESNIENVTLFPNPSSKNIFIKNLNGDELITMYDLLGRVVEIPFQNAESNSEIVADISSLKRGLYLVVISDVRNNSKRTISVIKN